MMLPKCGQWGIKCPPVSMGISSSDTSDELQFCQYSGFNQDTVTTSITDMASMFLDLTTKNLWMVCSYWISSFTNGEKRCLVTNVTMILI